MFTVFILSLQFCSKKLTNPLVTQHPPHFQLADSSIYSPLRIKSDWIYADVKQCARAIGQKGKSINTTPHLLKYTMLPPSMRHKNTLKCEIKIKRKRRSVFKIQLSVQSNLTSERNPLKCVFAGQRDRRLKPHLKELQGKKANEPGHPTLQSDAAKHDNGN